MKQNKNKDAAGSSGKSPSGEAILIKKYPNRRLYNTASSTYIVLDDVVDLVKAGTPFVIEDKKTGEDITRTILNQIIFEQEIKPSNFHFPLEFQKQLIAMYGDSYGQMVPNYLTESLNLFTAEREQMGHAFESAVNQNTRAMLEYSQKLARQNMEMFKQSWSMFGMAPQAQSDTTTTETSAAAAAAEPSSDDNGRTSELKNIQSQIDALQERLKSLK